MRQVAEGDDMSEREEQKLLMLEHNLSGSYLFAWILDGLGVVNQYPAVDLTDLFGAWVGGGPL